MIFYYILLCVYAAAINFYAVVLVKRLKEESESSGKKSDGRLFLTGLLCGAIAIYACLFAFKYRQKSLALMLLMPLLGALNVIFYFFAFRCGQTIFVSTFSLAPFRPFLRAA